MRDVDFFMSLPWTVVSSTREDDGTYIVLEIRELPGFLVTAEPGEDVDGEFWIALEDFLESYLEEGKRPPIPDGAEERVTQWEEVSQALADSIDRDRRRRDKTVQGERLESAAAGSSKIKHGPGSRGTRTGSLIHA